MHFTFSKSIARKITFAAALFASVTAYAGPITYLFSGLASGTNSQTAFSSAALTITINTDTANIGTSKFGSNTPATTNLVAGSISLTGVGAGTFNDLLYVFNNKINSTVGFGSMSNSDLINVTNSVVGLNTYDLVSNFGPIAGDSLFFRQFSNVGWSLGSLSITSFANGTFQASTGTNSVPEPASFALFGLALAAIAATRRRKI